MERVHPEDRARLKATSDRAIVEQSDYDVEFRILIPRSPINSSMPWGRLSWAHRENCCNLLAL